MLKGLSLHLGEWDRLQGEYEQLQVSFILLDYTNKGW